MSTIHGVAFDASGTLLLAAQDDGLVSVWRIANRLRAFELAGHEEAVRGVSCHPTAPLAASGSLDGAIMLWNLASGDYEPRFARHPISVLALAFSPDGTRLASTGEDGSIAVWRVPSGDRVASMTHDHSVMSVAWLPDGRGIVTGSADGRCIVWNLDGSERVRHKSIWGPAFGVAAAADGRLAMACSRATSIIDGGEVRDVRARGGMSQAVRFTRDAIAIGTGPHILVVANDGTERELASHTEPVTSLACLPDGTTLASGSEDGSVRLWNLASKSARPTKVFAPTS